MKSLGEEVVKLIPGTKIVFTEISFEDARNYQVTNNKSKKYFEYKTQHTLETEVNSLVKLFKEHRICNIKDDTYHNGQFIKNNLSSF